MNSSSEDAWIQRELLLSVETKISDIHEAIGEAFNPFNVPTMIPLQRSKTAERSFRSEKLKADKFDPVSIGDLISLRATGLEDNQGYLLGDQAFGRCGLQVQSSSENEALNFSDCVFRVCPPLSYRYANEAEAMRVRQTAFQGSMSFRPSFSPRSFSKSPSTSFSKLISFDEIPSELSSLSSRIELEKDSNNRMLQRVREGAEKDVVIIGGQYQLQHVNSGLFLSLSEDAAPLDPGCRALTLSEGSPTCYFRAIRCFKAQTEGSPVSYSHSVKFESGKIEGIFIHVSPQSYNSEFLANYSGPLPKCLRNGEVLEVNMSDSATNFVLNKYARFSQAEENLLKTGRCFRVYHPQSESFMQASCDQDKIADLTATFNHGLLPSHSPYLKAIYDFGREADPTNPRNHNAKGVWSFEPLSRSHQTSIPWNSAVRVRHVPSGCYLAVNGSRLNEDESWFPTILVEDSIDEMHSIFFESSASGSSSFLQRHTVFHVTSADILFGTHIPKGDTFFRLEHHFIEEGTMKVYYLSNMIVTAANPSLAHSVSHNLIFTAAESVQDVFRILPMTEDEEMKIREVKALLIPCHLYAMRLADPDISIQRDLKVYVKIMLRIIDLQLKHAFSYQADDWIQKSHSMPPGPFSLLFDGAENTAAQLMCRDMKLMDVVFKMASAPYIRNVNHPWGESEAMYEVKAIQKFIYVALQRMCHNCPSNQIYFGRKRFAANTIVSDKCLSQTNKGLLWMDTLLVHIRHPLGSAITLASLLSANKELLDAYATPRLLQSIVNLVRELGPQARLMQFIASMCLVQERPVLANQEMVLRLTWLKPDIQKQLHLTMEDVEVAQVKPALKSYSPVYLPNGSLSTRIENRHPNFPQDYLGKDAFEQEGCFNPVFVSWRGHMSWYSGMKEGWVWNSVSLQLPVYHTPKGDLVRIEDLCWVLDGALLCAPITGVDWDRYKEMRDNDVAMTQQWERQHMLASYFVEQLNLYSRMVTGRSSSCIIWLESTFTFTLLVSLCYNDHLPPLIRAAATDLVRALYLDRFPQMPNCGRSNMPERLWVYKLSMATRYVDVDAVAHIKPVALSYSDALPRFMISSSHPLFVHPNPIYGFPNMSKFFLLRRLCITFLRNYGDGQLVYHSREENLLVGTICRLVSELFRFGFMSSEHLFKEVLSLLVKILDGRNDAELVDIYEETITFSPPKKRYEMTSYSPLITQLKVDTIQSFMLVADMRTNFRVAKFLQTFKEYNEDSSFALELRKFQVYFIHDKEGEYEGALTDSLYEQFEALFQEGDGRKLQFEELTSCDMAGVLLDCLMYEDDNLFASALGLLERIYTQRKEFLASLGDIILLPFAEVPVFGQVDVMISELAYLGYLSRSYTIWGMSSRVSGTFDFEMSDKFVSTNEKVLEFLKAEPYHQDDKMRHSLRRRTFTKFQNSAPPVRKRNKILQYHLEMDGDEEDLDEVLDSENTTSAAFTRLQSFEPPLEEENEGAQATRPEKLHQDMLRSLQLHVVLDKGLAIDYNLVFKGTICYVEQKIKSRELLVACQRKTMEVLFQFVKGNEANQIAVIELSLPRLMRYFGPLKIPDKIPEEVEDNQEEMELAFPTLPRLGAEEVVIECVRGSVTIAENMLPKELFTTFGHHLNQCPDPSDSFLLEFFELACRPHGSRAGNVVPRNQLLFLETFLSTDFPKLKAQVLLCFELESMVDCKKPQNISALVSCCLVESNKATAALLAAHKMGIDATLSTLKKLVLKAKRAFTKLANNGLGDTVPLKLVESGSHLCNMILVLSCQMDCLVVDPRIYHRAECWDLIYFAIPTMFQTFLIKYSDFEDFCHSHEGSLYDFHNEENRRFELLLDDLPLLREAVCVVMRLLTGARNLGIHDYMVISPKDATREKLSRVVGELDECAITKMDHLLCSHLSTLGELLDPIALRRLSDPNRDNRFLLFQSNSSSPSLLNQEFELQEHEELNFEGINKPQPPHVMFHYMVDALNNNPKVVLKLQLRRFQLAEVLEGIEERIATSKPSDQRVNVAWGEVVARMVRYLQVHNFDKDATHLIRIFSIFRSTVLRARCGEDGAEIPFENSAELHSMRHEEYTKKQNFLNSRGVTAAACMAISTRAAGVEGSVADEALELLKELLFTGNHQVQLSVINYISDEDKDSKFLEHFKTRMLVSQDVIQERKQTIAFAFEPMTELQREGYENAKQTFTVLQQLCEGHNVKTQDILRSQPMHQKDLNLVGEVVKMLALQVGSSYELNQMETLEVELLLCNLDLLIELVQGPCKGNQELIAKDESFLHCIVTVLQSRFHTRVNKGIRVQTKATLMILLSALLECREDTSVHQKMVQVLDPKMFEAAHSYFSQSLQDTVTSSAIPPVVRTERIDMIMTGAVCLKKVVWELNLVPPFLAFQPSFLQQQRIKNKGPLVFDVVTSIEVARNGSIEVVYFPLPEEIAYLTEATKERFLTRVSLDSAESRMKALLSETPRFITEMMERHSLAERFRLYKILSKHIVPIKRFIYVLVVLLNLNVMMAGYGDKHSEKGYNSSLLALSGNIRSEYYVSLAITLLLALLIACGDIVIVAFLGITEIPFIIRQTDQVSRDRQQLMMPPYNVSVFTSWAVIFAGILMFILMHAANYPKQPNLALYGILVFGVAMPWFFVCLRTCINITSNHYSRFYVIIYDTVLRKKLFRNHLMLFTCNILGFRFPPFFTLMLLDIVNNSFVLRDIIRSITRPLPQLAVVFYTFVITVVIYAQFGVHFFEEWFHYDSLADDATLHGCHSVVACFWLIFYQGVPLGGMSEVLDNVSNRDGNTYLARLAFDLSFFVWVGILLFNVITGLIVDTFSSLREEANRRESVLTDSCFVCGISRDQYDDYGLPNSAPNFDVHQKEVHGMWNYVCFYFHLKKKAPSEYNGVESYVAALLKASSTDWIPAKSTFATQSHVARSVHKT